MKKYQWMLWFFANVLLLHSASVISATNVIQVYGTTESSQLDARYMLQLASFKNKSNAQAYVAEHSRQTTETLHIAYVPAKKIPYQVYIGPLADLKTLHVVSQQLLLKAPSVKREPPYKSKSNVSYERTWSPVVTASMGFGWNNVGEMQTILVQPDVGKAYIATDTTGSIFQGELFAGVQQRLNPRVLGQVGVAFAGATGAGMNGEIWEDADPELANYTYNYRINHSRVAIEGKLLADLDLLFMPYVNGSVGAGFNKAYNFTIRPKLEEEIPAPDFQSNTTTSFTYTVGVGLQKALNKHWQMGLGYQFADWGNSQFAPAPEQTLNTGLAQSHIYVNSILFNLSYFG